MLIHSEITFALLYNDEKCFNIQLSIQILANKMQNPFHQHNRPIKNKYCYDSNTQNYFEFGYLGTFINERIFNLRMMVSDIVADCSALRSIEDIHADDEFNETGGMNFALEIFDWPKELSAKWMNDCFSTERDIKQQRFRYEMLKFMGEFRLNLLLLFQIYETKDYNLSSSNLVEAIRLLDILGSNKLYEYELLFFTTEIYNPTVYDFLDYDILPISYENRKKEYYKKFDFLQNISRIGSFNLIQAVLENRVNLVKDFKITINIKSIFQLLCYYGHFQIIEWMYNLYGEEKLQIRYTLIFGQKGLRI
jgi:hypothetical protein